LPLATITIKKKENCHKIFLKRTKRRTLLCFLLIRVYLASLGKKYRRKSLLDPENKFLKVLVFVKSTMYLKTGPSWGEKNKPFAYMAELNISPSILEKETPTPILSETYFRNCFH
jgi:hypothetical protein